MPETMPVLVVGNTAIPFEICRSARARRRRIVVTPDRVEVVAPEGQSDEEIAAYVHRRRRWVFDSLETLHERAAGPGGAVERARPGRFVSGAKILYRGRRMRLRVLPALDSAGREPAANGARSGVGAQGGVRVEYRSGFVVYAPLDSDAERRDARIGAALEAWFRERVREDAEHFVRRHAPRLGVEPTGVRIKEQKHLWGSCGRDGTIHLNWQLIFAPRPVLEYAVAHELCHLRERTHGPAFWRVLREALPQYEAAKAWLERHEWVCRWR